MSSLQQLLIPSRVKVGYQKRDDTYTGRLAYVIYYDGKGKLRKEASWQSWRDEALGEDEYDNAPTEGFVLNRPVGGYKTGWDYRSEHIRVYDPRGFEFEISVANLLFILRECDCSRGKGLEGSFVYAWAGIELVLLPVASADYANSLTYTSLQGRAVKAKDLIPGATYLTKNQVELVYLGRLMWHPSVVRYYATDRPYNNDGPTFPERRHIFYRRSPANKGEPHFTHMRDLKSVAVCKETCPVADYAELADAFYKSPHGSKVVSLRLKQAEDATNLWHIDRGDGTYLSCTTCFAWKKKNIEYITYRDVVSLREDGVIVQHNCSRNAYPPNNLRREWYYQADVAYPYHEPTGLALIATLESGAQYVVNGYGLLSPAENQEDNDE